MIAGINKYRFWCLVWVTFGSIVYGFDSGITTSVLGYPVFLEYFAMNANTIGAFNSAYYAAATVGAMLNWYFPNRVGRIRSLQGALIISSIGIVIQTAAQNYGMFVAGRIIGGAAIGSLFACCPVLASELSPPYLRGRVAVMYAINVAVGYMVTEWLAVGFSFVGGNGAWRTLFGFQLVPTAVMIVGSFWMPESPRWLILVDRHDEAATVLRNLHEGESNTFISDTEELTTIRAQVELDKEEHLGLKAIFHRKSYIRRVVLVVLFFLFQQLTGIIPISSYQVVIYGMVGFSPFVSLVLTAVFGTVSTIAAFLSFPIDKIGRRPAVLTAFVVMIIGNTLIVALWARVEATGNLAYGKGVIFSMYFWSLGYCGVMNTFAALYAAEIMPTNIRAAGVSLGYATFNAIVILLVQITPLAIEHISWRFFSIFIACDVVFLIIFYFFYPETKNRSLEQLEAIFGDKVDEAVAQTMHDLDLSKSAVHTARHYENADSETAETAL